MSDVFIQVENLMQSVRLLEQGRYDELTEGATSQFRRMVDLQALR
jgi:hypothetical protein